MKHPSFDRAQYYLDNKEKLNEYAKEYYKKNKEKLKRNAKKAYRKNPGRAREREVMRKFGMSADEWNSLVEAQNNLCAICGGKQIQERKNLDVDHCHKTKKVRGLLCGHCNRGLGLFMDNPELLQKAALYLHKVRG